MLSSRYSSVLLCMFVWTPRNNPDEPQNRRLHGCYIQFAKRHHLPIQEAERHPVLRKQVIKSPTNYFTKYTGCNQQTCSKHNIKLISVKLLFSSDVFLFKFDIKLISVKLLFSSDVFLFSVKFSLVTWVLYDVKLVQRKN